MRIELLPTYETNIFKGNRYNTELKKFIKQEILMAHKNKIVLKIK